jgi:hypothetical protein
MLNKADEVSVQVGSAEAFIAHAAKWRRVGAAELRSRFQEQRARLGAIIANVDFPMSVDRILDALDRLDVPEAPAGFKPAGMGSALRSHIRAALGRLIPSKKFQKFSGVNEEDILGPVACWVGAGVLKEPPRISRLAGGTFLFSKG